MPKLTISHTDVGAVERKSLLYRSEVEYGGWTINHCQGCPHGCLYPCYAMQLAKRTGRVKTYEEWCRPRIVANAMELLEQELKRYAGQIDSVHLSFTTDPFPYDAAAEAPITAIADLSTRIVKRLNDAGIRVTLLTKGVYPEAFIALAQGLDPRNSYGISLVSMSDAYQRTWEPGAAPLMHRVEALKKLHLLGLRTWVSMEPFPTPNIDPTSVDPSPVLEAVEFTNAIVFGRWNYNRLATSHAGADPHYEAASKRVAEWCDARGTCLRIKTGTPLTERYNADVLGVPDAA